MVVTSNEKEVPQINIEIIKEPRSPEEKKTEKIIIVGTNHIAKESLEKIKESFLEQKPNIIAVELDKERLLALLNPEPKHQKFSFIQIKKLGIGTFIFLHIAKYIQQQLGNKTGIKPGSDMLFAVQLAKNNNISLALIDKPLQITLKKLIKELTIHEKLRFFTDLFFGIFKKSQRKMAKDIQQKINLNSIPSIDVIDYLLLIVKKRYPTVHRVLVQERNEYMAKQISVLSKKYPDYKIMAVVGAGHQKEISRLVTKYIEN